MLARTGQDRVSSVGPPRDLTDLGVGSRRFVTGHGIDQQRPVTKRRDPSSAFGSRPGAVALSFAGWLLEKVDARILLTGMFLITGATYLAAAAAHNLTVLYAVGLVQGITKTTCVSLAIAILLANWFDKQLGLLMGITGALTAVGGSIFSPMVGSWITASGWRHAYVLTAVIMLVTILSFTIFITRMRRPGLDLSFGYDLEESQETGADSGVRARDAFRSAPFIAFVVVFLHDATGGCSLSLSLSHLPLPPRRLPWRLQPGAARCRRGPFLGGGTSPHSAGTPRRSPSWARVPPAPDSHASVS